MNDLVRFSQGVQMATGRKRGRRPVFNSRMFYPYKEELRLRLLLKKELERYIAEAYAVAVQGEIFSDDLNALSNLGENLPEDFRNEVTAIGQSIARHVSNTIANSSEMIVGKPYYPPEAKADIFRSWEANFQTLCKSAESDAKKEISRLVTTAKNEGWNGRQLEKAVMKELPAKYAHRAELIARTESAKLNSEVTRATYREIGCQYYKWMATPDERTRPEHAAMNDVICSVDDPTVYFEENPDDPLHPVRLARTGDMVHLHPGEDFQCRCTMVMWDPEIDGQYEVKETPEEKPEEKEQTELEKAKERIEEQKKELERTERELAQQRNAREKAEERLSGAREENILQNEAFQKSERELFEIRGNEAMKAVDKKKIVEKAAKENEFGLPLMLKPETALASLELANSKAEKNVKGFLALEWDDNCQRSVIAYEARRRGYNVFATKSFDNDILAMANNPDLWTLVFKNAELVMIDSYHPKTIEYEITKALKKYGHGSRVVIRYEGKFGNEGHVFIGENVNGRIFFIDPQTNEFYGTEIFCGQKKKSFGFTRVDKLKFTDKIRFAVD